MDAKRRFEALTELLSPEDPVWRAMVALAEKRLTDLAGQAERAAEPARDGVRRRASYARHRLPNVA